MKKIMSLLLVVVLALGVLSGCTTSNDGQTSGGSSAKADSELPLKELKLPLCEEKQELSVWLVYSGTIVKDLNEIESVKKMEEITNVHINWIPISQDELSDKLGILLSSGNYPDIIYPGSLNFPGGFEKGVADGVINPDHDILIHNYMPNYMAYLNSNEEARKEATSDSGEMIIIKNIVGDDFTAQSEGTYLGLAYRKDLLEDMGLEVPTTVDGWHDVFVQAKANGVDYPLMLDTNGGSAFSLSWGVATQNNADYVQIDGNKVVGVALQDGFGQYLETMRQWYAEGLINPNFTSFNFYLDTPGSVENNQGIMYSQVISAFTGNNYNLFHMCNNEKEWLEPITAPLLHEGDKPIQCGERVIAKDAHIITTSCKNPELAAMWLDFQYSREGELLNWYGIEGVTYEMKDGDPQYTEMVLHPENQSSSDLMQKYALDWGNTWLGKHNAWCGVKLQNAATGAENQQMIAVDIWSSPEINVSVPTRAWTPTEDEGDEINKIMSAVRTLIEEYTINYIIGNTDQSFDEFKAQLTEYGYDKAIALYQGVYDRYLGR